MRVSSARGSPTLVFASRSPRACSTASRYCAGAMARRMAVHFCPAFTVISVATSLIEIELRRSGPGVRPKQGGVEAVLLRHEADGLPHYDGVRPKLERGVGGPREADDVLAGQMVEQVADSADDKLDRARR